VFGVIIAFEEISDVPALGSRDRKRLVMELAVFAV
jgi:hypothetical protein